MCLKILPDQKYSSYEETESLAKQEKVKSMGVEVCLGYLRRGLNGLQSVRLKNTYRPIMVLPKFNKVMKWKAGKVCLSRISADAASPFTCKYASTVVLSVSTFASKFNIVLMVMQARRNWSGAIICVSISIDTIWNFKWWRRRNIRVSKASKQSISQFVVYLLKKLWQRVIFTRIFNISFMRPFRYFLILVSVPIPQG